MKSLYRQFDEIRQLKFKKKNRKNYLSFNLYFLNLNVSIYFRIF